MTSITAKTGAKVEGQLLARNGAVTLDNNIITNGICDYSPATLHVIKHVINDDGGKSTAADFNLHVKIAGKDVANSPALGAESPGNTYTLAAGTYNISEDSSEGYIAKYGGDSDVNGNITLAPGENKTIIITNNDIELAAINNEVIVPPVPTEKGLDTTTPTEKVVTRTVTGGQLPKTSTHLYEILLLGAFLSLGGILALKNKKSYE